MRVRMIVREMCAEGFVTSTHNISQPAISISLCCVSFLFSFLIFPYSVEKSDWIYVCIWRSLFGWYDFPCFGYDLQISEQ